MKAVFRIAKLKTWGNVGGAAAHNHRLRETKNANPAVENIILLKPPGDMTVVEYAQQKLSGLKIRSNAVLCVEAVISASPEFFRPDDPARAGYYQPEKLKAWREAMEPWIKKNFPHAVSVVLHLDEATPHYQVIDVPLDKDGKLNCRAKFGGVSKMSAWQTSVAKPMKPLGIERGIDGSAAEHTTIAEFYSAANTTMQQLGINVPKVKTPKPEPLPAPTLKEKIPGTDAHKERLGREKAFEEQQRKHMRELAARNREIAKVLPSVVEKGKAVDIAQEKQKGAEATAAKLAKENAELRAAAAKADADRLRGLPLGEVLRRMYGAELDRKSKETHATRKYRYGDGSEMAITDKPGVGEVWFDQHANKGGKGAINLVMHLEQCQYKQAIRMLGESFGSAPLATEVQIVPPPAPPAAQIVSDAIKTPAPVPTHVVPAWPRVKAWLIEQRKIPARLVDFLRKHDLVRADVRRNAVFPRAQNGAFVRGTGSLTFFRAYGGKDGGPFTIQGGSSTVILCESAIDACSLKAIHPDATVHALGGNMIRPDELRSLVPQTADVRLAFDADAQGKVFTAEALAAFPGAQTLELPQGVKDWNEALQRGVPADVHWISDAEKTAREAAEAVEKAKAAAEAEERRKDEAHREQQQRAVAQRALQQTRARPKP
jgi:hypothetical protein